MSDTTDVDSISPETETAPQQIIEFWFGQGAEAIVTDRNALWFGANAEIDNAIQSRFGQLISAAERGELNHWQSSAVPSLALIILLDQFTRNVYRGSERAFASDHLALAVCQAGLADNFDKALTPSQRAFYYLPLEHAEDLACQQRSVALFEALAAEVAASHGKQAAEIFAGTKQYADEHHDIIARFGRFPHRNALLDRQSTAEELAFLDAGGQTFGQSSN